jgi:hypothetical protein
MPRIRTVKFDLFQHEGLAALEIVCRYAFIGLFTLADREGRLEDRPRRIAAQLFPYDRDIDFQKVLDSLVGGGFVERYSVEGHDYLQIVSFLKHQRPNIREPKSMIPTPHVQDTATHMRMHGGAAREGEREWSKREKTLSSSSPVGDGFGGSFDVFWREYPRKVGKGAAFKAWNKILSPSQVLIAILHALEWQCKSIDWIKDNGAFIPHPATYLNQQRWLDEPSPPNGPTLSPDSLKAMQAARRFIEGKKSND